MEDDNGIFLASMQNRAVGYVWYAIEHRPENAFKYGQERMYIHQISVDPGYHRKGVGIKLMEAVEQVARENNIRKFALDSWIFNKEAHAFFKQLGFSHYNINMWRETTVE